MPDNRHELHQRGHEDDQSTGLADVLGESEHGISEQERAEIRTQLDSFVARREPVNRDDQLHYEARHRRDILPAIIGIGSVLSGIAAAVALFVVFERQEQTLLADAASTDTAEAQLLEEFRAEAEQRLAAQEGEIARIRDELSSLEVERDTAIQEAEVEFLRREAELKAGLDRELAAERSRLEQEGLSGERLETRLTDVETELTAQHTAELEQVRTEHEASIAEREARLETLESAYRRGVEQLSRFDELSVQTTGELTEQRSEEEVSVRLLTERYERAIGMLVAGDYAEAHTALQQIGAAQEDEEAEHPSLTRDRTPVSRELITALSRLSEIEQENPAALAARAETSEARVRTLEAELAGADRTISRLDQQLSEARSTIRHNRQAATEAQERIDELRSELRSVHNELAAEASTLRDGSNDLGEIFASVDIRLEILDALRSEPVRREYPELDEAFESYLDAFARAHERDGSATALARAANRLENALE